MINKDEKKINLGLQLLRMISAFWVVIVHCYIFMGISNLNYYIHQKPFHVPNFMFLSFYFYYGYLLKRNIKQISQRFKRLLIPYLLWPLIFLITNNICLKFFGFGNYRKKITIKDYFLQIIFGAKFHRSFWYLSVVLFLSLFFTILAFLIPRYFLFVIQLFGFIIYRIHLSSIYENHFLKISQFFENPLLLTVRFVPLAVIGLTCADLKVLSFLKKKYIRNIVINSIFLYFLFRFELFKYKDYYIYKDVGTITIGAMNFFFVFSLFPLEEIKNNKILSIIKHISNYTGGIYYLHLVIAFYFKTLIKKLRNTKFFGIFFVYIISYCICFFGTKIFKKNKLKYLFN